MTKSPAQEKFDRRFARRPRPAGTFASRPHLSRRRFLRLAGAGVTASWLGTRARAAIINSTPVQTLNKARKVIFILMQGAPSHTDTFDLKFIDGITPATLGPDTINGVFFPTGLMPKLAGMISDLAIVRSVEAWALAHSVSQVWTQIGRNPAGVLGNVSPNIGSVIALEKEPERLPSQVFPTFLALNAVGASGPGYLSAEYGPFKVTPSTSGLPNTTNPDGEARLDARWNLLHQLDDPLRLTGIHGREMSDYDQFYSDAKAMMYNPAVAAAFKYSQADSVRYGSSSFGNACIIARQAITANQGTRYIEIMQGSWDMHQNIYAPNQLPLVAGQLDNGLSQLIADLKASGDLDSTLIVAAGEFGRTVGPLTTSDGRDHYLQQFAVFAGAGITGGKVIGATDATGATIVDPGWSRGRAIKPEDIEATIYSAMGINWTTVRYDDPLGRGFYYVPDSDQDIYGPVNELWS